MFVFSYSNKSYRRGSLYFFVACLLHPNSPSAIHNMAILFFSIYVIALYTRTADKIFHVAKAAVLPYETTKKLRNGDHHEIRQ